MNNACSHQTLRREPNTQAHICIECNTMFACKPTGEMDDAIDHLEQALTILGSYPKGWDSIEGGAKTAEQWDAYDAAITETAKTINDTLAEQWEAKETEERWPNGMLKRIPYTVEPSAPGMTHEEAVIIVGGEIISDPQRYSIKANADRMALALTLLGYPVKVIQPDHWQDSWVLTQDVDTSKSPQIGG